MKQKLKRNKQMEPIMNKKIGILHLEDSLKDFELIRSAILT